VGWRGASFTNIGLTFEVSLRGCVLQGIILRERVALAREVTRVSGRGVMLFKLVSENGAELGASDGKASMAN